MNVFISCFIPVAAVILSIVLLPGIVFAQTANMSAEQLSNISNRCSSAQISLEQLQRRDAVSRINRGRTYDQLMTQISALHSRLAFNKASTPPELLAISSEVQERIDRFRSVSDKEYLEHLINAIKIDCKNKPAEFYALIVSARDDRDNVVAEITKINELMGSYREKLVLYQSTLPSQAAEGQHAN